MFRRLQLWPFHTKRSRAYGPRSPPDSRRPYSEKDQKLVDEAMEQLGILQMSRYLFNEMSGGEKQMVLVARALAQQARILIMDEPTANLDYCNQIKMLKVIKTLSENG